MDDENFHFTELADDTEPLEHVLRWLEGHVDKDGWDQNPLYLVLHWSEISPEVRISFITAAAIPFPRFCYEEPGLYLLPMVELLAHKGKDFPGAKGAYSSVLGPGFYGVAMIFEGWGLPPSVPEAEAKAASRSRTIDQHPKRIEERIAMAVTVDGRVATVKHVRGEEPTYHESDPIEENIVGQIPAALRILCDHLEQMAQLYAIPST